MSLFVIVLRWLARLSALVVAGGFAAMAVGEMVSPQSAPPQKLVEWTGIILLSLACAGMLLAWRWELPGAVISLAALIAFSLLITLRKHAVLVVMATPAFLFLADWLLRWRFVAPPRAA